MALESVHAVTYFAPACRRALRESGLAGFWAGYFAARAAPLGRVGPGPVSAAFYNFHPDMVDAAVPGCWEVATPAALTVVRAEAASTALGEICSPGALDRARGVLPELRRVTSHWTGAGRILGAANRVLWPEVEPALARRGTAPEVTEVTELWQACTTLREHRGDGHVAALVAHGLGGCEAHVLAAARSGTPVGVLRDNRGWGEWEWDQAARNLADQGLIHAGTITDDGLALYQSIEAMTDDLAESAYAPMTDAQVNAVYAALEPCAREIQGSGLLPFPNPMGLPRL